MPKQPKVKTTTQDGAPQKGGVRAPNSASPAIQGASPARTSGTALTSGDGQIRKRGGQAKNTNAVRHGLKSSKLPARLQWAERRTNAFRKIVEEAVLTTYGEITLTQAATINTMIRWERLAILAGYWLSKELDNLNPDQRLKHAEYIAKASDNRDKCIKALGLDVREIQPWEAFNGDIPNGK